MPRRRWIVLGITGLVGGMLLVPAGARGAARREAGVRARGAGRSATISVVPASVRVRCGPDGRSGQASITVTAHGREGDRAGDRMHPQVVVWTLGGERLGEVTLTRLGEAKVISSDAVPCVGIARRATTRSRPLKPHDEDEHDEDEHDEDEQECEDEDNGPFSQPSRVSGTSIRPLDVDLHCVDDAS